jgi:hypothetical protein
VVKLNVVFINGYHPYQLPKNFIEYCCMKLTQYIYEIILDHRCGFQNNRSTKFYIFYIRQLSEKKWEGNETIPQLFTDFKKACDSVRREIFSVLALNLVFGIYLYKQIVKLNG